MTFTQLRAFLEVARCSSVNEAARRLFVSPPAVSAAVAALQRELGVSLVCRSGRGLVITPAGAVFARYARQILQLVDEAAAATAEALDPERGRDHVWELLDQRQVDLAIGGRPPGGSRFVTLATRANVLVLVAAAGLNGTRSPHSVAVADLARQTLLLREPGSGTRSTAEELFDELGISPATLTLGSNGAIRESVQVGLGVTLISRDAVARELDEGSLVEWSCPTLPRHRAWHLVARANEELPPTAALFLAHLAASSADGFSLVAERDPD